MAWINAVYDRTQEDVNNETDKGFLNESDWSRIINNYNELKVKYDEFFSSKNPNTQEPNIEEEYIPEAPALNYYITNNELNTLCLGINKMYKLLKKDIEGYIVLPENYRGGVDSEGLFIEDINNIEKDLELIYLNIDSVLDLAESADFATSFGGGNGSESNPYLITSCAEYAYLCEQSKTNSFEGIYFKITKYLNFERKYINNNTIQIAPYTNIPFKGYLDGQSYTLRGLYSYSASFLENMGLIGCTEGATIKNLNSYGNTFQLDSYLGMGAALIGQSNNSIIDNCKIYNSTIYYGGGGLIYKATNSTISNCLVQKVTMRTNIVGGGSAGLIRLCTRCIITNCEVNSFDTFDQQNGTQYSAGFISICENTNITNCKSINLNIEGNIESYNNYTSNSRSGGFIGKCTGGSISKCFCQGKITGRENMGGFIGEANNITIDQSYAYCDVYGVTGYVTGFIGYINTYPIKITNSYSRGSVNRYIRSNMSVLEIHLSGFVPYINIKGNTISYCYSSINYNSDDKETISSKTTIYGIGGASKGTLPYEYVSGTSYYDTSLNNSPEETENEIGSPKTSQELKDKTKYSIGWNFTSIWDISEEINDGYAYLRNV